VGREGAKTFQEPMSFSKAINCLHLRGAEESSGRSENQNSRCCDGMKHISHEITRSAISTEDGGKTKNLNGKKHWGILM